MVPNDVEFSNTKGFTENGVENKKHPLSSCYAGRKALMRGAIRGEGSGWCEVTERISENHSVTVVRRKASPNLDVDVLQRHNSHERSLHGN